MMMKHVASARSATRLVVPVLALTVLWLLLGVTDVGAQGAEPSPTATPAPSGTSADDIAGAMGGLLTNALPRLIGDALTNWFNTAGPGMFGRVISTGFGLLAEVLWELAGGMLTGVNIFTQIPGPWSYGLSIVAEMRGRLTPVATSIIGAAVTAAIAWIAGSMAMSRPFPRAVNHLPTVLLATGGVLAAPALTQWWIDLVNAMSGALNDPSQGIPGLDAVQGFDRISALGVVAVVYLVVALMLLLHRVKLVGLTVVLLIASPLVGAAWALPFPWAQRFVQWWVATFLAATFVQVLQGITLGVGATLLSSPVVSGRFEGPAQGMFSALIGVGMLLLTMQLPGMLLGSLARGNVSPGMLSTALQVGSVLSGFAWAGALRAAAPAMQARITPLAPMGMSGGATITPISGYVRSILAAGPAAPKMLPPPRD